jgi:hypothetical protein
MERLTYRDKDGFPMMKKRGGFKQGGVERLAAYEDTGRTPEEVTALGKLFDYALEESKTLTEQLALLNRIRDLAEADRDGRLVVPPCKVGDTVWAVSGKIIKCEIDEAYLCGGGGIEYIVTFDCDGSDCKGCPFSRWEQDCFGECYCECEYGCSSFKDSDIGKTVFLTSEEAEKALEGKRNA